ncbi:MAG: type II/IV secretion system protein, partial [Candidatus Omnitrophica bacterium]|nr:type II/IV secretion system protein [Candidatus Omnitrophota bacterium]
KNILEILKLRYGLAADTIQEIMAKTPRGGEAETAEGKVENIEILGDEEASVIKLVNQIILDAYKARATDIHIEPYRGRIKIRYRVDGVLYNAPVPEDMVHFYNSMLSRIKIMSNLDIVERRLPQDGRAVVRVGNQKVDLRISSMPTPYGESLVIRVLPATMLFSLEKLGLSSSDLTIFEKLVQKPHGIIFVTGPTGSGKTTSLYACLSTINTDVRKIITIEDPIEYELEGITQIQVLPEIGFDFARGLRSMLRHDPDIMMVGEVRDLETAEIAIRVALTGHLVFSTLHTNDAASGITRLVDIGVGPYLVASSVEAFIAQRLVRLICPHCKVEDASQPKEIRARIARELKLDLAEKITLFKGNGCKECNFTGFHGRAAIFEILLVDEVIKDLVSKKASSMQIKKKAIERGMQTLRQDGLKKVIAGLTTPEEVMKLTQAEENADI